MTPPLRVFSVLFERRILQQVSVNFVAESPEVAEILASGIAAQLQEDISVPWAEIHPTIVQIKEIEEA